MLIITEKGEVYTLRVLYYIMQRNKICVYFIFANLALPWKLTYFYKYKSSVLEFTSYKFRH